MKKSNLLPTLFFSLTLLFSSCAKVYYSPDARQKAATHKIIAIIAPKVSISGGKITDTAAIQAQEAAESVNYQKEMYAWLLKRKRQGRMTIDIQELDVTNVKLKKLDLVNNPTTSSDLCKALGVDGVITSSISSVKTMGDGAALGLVLLTGGFMPNKNITIDLSVNDSEKLLFNYSHKMGGSVLSSPANIVDALMRNSSKKMPYAIQP
jgi:fructose-bisphosphate aldolase class 1